MTTCGHVAGAAFFYHPPEEVLENFASDSTKVFVDVFFVFSSQVFFAFVKIETAPYRFLNA